MEGYHLKIIVQGSSQPIWRVVEVAAKMTFMDLHLVFQKVFGLNNEFLFRFDLEEINILVIKLDDRVVKTSNQTIIFCNEKIDDYLYEGMVFNYLYNLQNYWEFKVVVEKELVEVERAPKVIEYFGNNLIERCRGILEYEQMLNKLDINQFRFNLHLVNEDLKEFEVDDVINNAKLKNDFILILNDLKNIIEKRDIETYQVIKLNGRMIIYWVIIKTIEGYVIELFENYEDLLQGFYNLQMESFNHAFCYCYTFMLSDKEIKFGQTLDQDRKIAAFFNEPGYLPCLISVNDGIAVLEWLEEFLIGLTHDHNISDTDEIIEINLKDHQFNSSFVYVHEPQIDTSRFDITFRNKENLNTTLALAERVCIDIICLPTPNTYMTNELQIYAIVATKDDYLIKEVLFPDTILMAEALIDIMIKFFNQNGKPDKVVVNNLNILILVLDFLNYNDIGYIEEDSRLEIDLVIADVFGFGDEINEVVDDSFVQELLNDLEEIDKEEIEAKLNELISPKELLN